MRRPVANAIVAAGLLCAALAGCGGSGPSDQQRVRGALQRFGRAVAQRDYHTVCSALLAPVLVERLAEIGLPCETALARGFGPVQHPTLAVRSVHVSGSSASALVHTAAANQTPSDDTVALAKIGGSWRISSLGVAPPPRAPGAKQR